MALLTIFKEHKLLLGATAILSVGSVAAAWAAGGGAIAGGILLAKFAEPLFNSMAAANLGDLAKKLQDSSQVLTNKDLTKAAGQAIALGIGEVIRESYPELADTFRGLVDRTENYWLQVDRSGESPGKYGIIWEN